MMKNLLGLFQQQPDQLQSLLGEYYDPRTAKMKWLGGTLQGLGMGLASGQPGAWATGLAQGGGQAVDDYRKEAQQGYMLAQAKQDQDWQAKERARKEGEWAKDDATSAQMQSLLGGIKDPNMRLWAETDPSGYFKAQYGPGEIKVIGGAGYNTKTGEWMVPPASSAGSGEYGLTPIWARDAAGNWQLYQPNKGGGPARAVQLPDGVSPQPQVSFQDLGTSVQAVTNRGAVPVGPAIPKDIAGVETQKVLGENEGKATAAAPSDLQAANNALDLLDKIEKSPDLGRGTGFSSYGNSIRGTAGYDFQNLVDQAKSGAFLSAIQQMRGMGSLSNAEGETATAAVNRMNTATSESAFLDALNDYRKIITQGRNRAASRIKAGQGNANNGPVTINGVTIEPIGGQ